MKQIAAFDPIRFVLWRRDHGGQLGGERRSDTLVRVEREHPLMRRRADSGVALRGNAGRQRIDDARARVRRNACRSVRRAGINDDDLVRPRQAAHTRANLARLVERGDHHGERRRHGPYVNGLVPSRAIALASAAARSLPRTPLRFVVRFAAW